MITEPNEHVIVIEFNEYLQISQWYDNFNTLTRGFELTIFC